MMERKEKIIMNKEQFLSAVTANLMTDYRTTLKEASPYQLHNAVARAVMADIMPKWAETEARQASGRRAYYLSAEFLMDVLYSITFTAQTCSTPLRKYSPKTAST